MKFIKNINWEEVFSHWKEREGKNPSWVRFAMEVKGWSSWEDWRRNSIKMLKPEGREWKLYEFEDPVKEIPQMLVGPFHAWQSRFEGDRCSFEELLDLAGQMGEWQENTAINSIIASLPFDTEFIGLVREDEDGVICLDGCHRATAITLAGKSGKKIDFSKSKITIVLFNLPKGEDFLFKEMLNSSSKKE